MATLVNHLAPWQNIGYNSSENLEDRFWAAFNFAIDDGPDDIYQSVSCDTVIPHSSMAIMRPVHPLVINSCNHGPNFTPNSPIRNVWPGRDNRHDRHCDRENSGSLRLQVPSSAPFMSSTISPTGSPVPTTAIRTRSHWHLPTQGGIIPSSPTLELVSNFLDSIVRLSDSRSSSPAAAITVADNGDTLVIESEVLIHVIEDNNPTAIDSLVETRKENNAVQLHIPPPSTVVVPGGGGYDLPTAFVATGPAGCAQELDALSWMSWDRQLSNVQHSLWH